MRGKAKGLKGRIDLREQGEKLREMGEGRKVGLGDGIPVLPEGRKEKRSVTLDRGYVEALELLAWYERRAFSELVEEAVARFMSSEADRLREALKHRDEFKRWREEKSGGGVEDRPSFVRPEIAGDLLYPGARLPRITSSDPILCIRAKLG